MPGADRGGRTPLHYAALADDTAAIHALLSQGADLNAADQLGFTALHFAAQQGAISAAGVLLAAGARVDAVNGDGNTPLLTAVFNSRGHGERPDGEGQARGPARSTRGEP